ncbi:MAG TPA: glutamate synthase small subunit, partial [Blastocatellia bacterium]|nr:glutamate synthase small subunit [Blastocatellia bacterium]
GHTVTVFERADRIGGLLMYGIPNMKLDKNIVQRRIDLMAEEGVIFKTSVNVGKDFPASDLLNDFDAVVLSGGATAARDLPIEGRNLKGIHLAMEFLHANTKSLLDSQHEDGNYISAQGKDVIVIGGGDTGTDCVGTSLRHGCKSLVQFEIMDRPPDERAPDNPWPQWPKVYKLDYGQEEAKARFGDDPRTYAILTQKFVGDDDGNLKELHTVNIKWGKDEQGRFGPQPIPGTEKVWPAQLVLLAMGFLGPEKGGMLEQLGVTLNERGNVAIDDNRMTNVPGVFAAGDMSRGQSLVVWAIRDGRDTARCVDLHLMGETQLP